MEEAIVSSEQDSNIQKTTKKHTLPIPYEKFKDLQQLKKFCGKEARTFYSQLPNMNTIVGAYGSAHLDVHLTESSSEQYLEPRTLNRKNNTVDRPTTSNEVLADTYPGKRNAVVDTLSRKFGEQGRQPGPTPTPEE
uniref:Uncharacterized protein n=1 Tax=Timema tahoe TaxID=61484 RepID=A0A7R9IJW8_9NEOP|nr:unnamed protein product [Timema tahoe]